MTQPNEEYMQNLPPDVRMDIGRAYNAYVRMKQAEYDVALARRDYMSYITKLRAGHGLSVRLLGAILTKSNDHVLRYSASFSDPEYETGQRKRASERQTTGRGKYRRKDRHLAGRRSDPEADPDVIRTRRTLSDAKKKPPVASRKVDISQSNS